MKKVLLALLLSGCAGGNIHAENDFFNPLQKNSDKYFTHGTRIGYDDNENNSQTTYAIGQNIYTPSKKRVDAPLEDLMRDRPYTGWLYGEYRDTKFNDEGTGWRTWGLQVGCSGPCSYARQTQSEVHQFLKQDVPTWNRNFELKSEPGAILEAEQYREIYGSTYSDSRVYGLAKVGNIVDSASIGLGARLGFGLDKVQSTPIVFKVPRYSSPWTLYIFSKIEQRLVPYNHFLQGSLFQDERHTVDTELSVQEINVGLTVGYSRFKFTYTWILFSPEWEERGDNFAFGGIDFQW